MNDKKRYSSDWINKLESKEHWLSYWHQLKLKSESLEPKDSIIELGIGSGFTSNYLRSKNLDVLTVDIDKKKSLSDLSESIRIYIESSFSETFYRDEVDSIDFFKSPIKGELTVIISEKNKTKKPINKEKITHRVRKYLKKYSLKDTVDLILQTEKVNKKEVYQLCLKIKNEKNN